MLALGIFFAVVWMLAVFTMNVASAAIHVLLIVAVASFVGHTVQAAGRSPYPTL